MNKHELYSPAILAGLEKKNIRRRIFLLSFILASLAVCIFLCTRVNTANEGRMELTVMAVSTVCGWIALYFGAFSVRAGKKEEAHTRRVLSAGQETLRGVVTVSERLVRIPGSITIYPAVLESDGEKTQLYLCASKRGLFPDSAHTRTVYTVDRFIVGYEAAP